MSNSNPIPTLEIQTGKHKGRRIPIKLEEMIIGRGTQARIRIPSPEVSREHCRIIKQGHRLIIEDLKSHNGTFINGRPITGKRFLSPGSTLTVGPMTFLLLGAGPPPMRPSSEVMLAGKVAVNTNYSDDEIVGWLSDNEVASSAAEAQEIESQETITDIPVVPPAQFLPRSKSSPGNQAPQ
ncbi:MAG TPA: FHA domain-containing protein [Planctomicrobium sp.]|nr:FHA domain-containing protein [Planctomicrobium sp.]